MMKPNLVLVLMGAAVIAPPTGAAAQASTVILVRHAEKTAGSGDEPVLSATGEVRSRALAAALEAARLDAILVTEYRRTRLTAAPVAARRHLTPIVVPVRGDSLAYARAVLRVLRARPRGDAVLVVGHSNTIPAIIAALGGPVLPELCANEYATLFVVTLAPRAPPHLIRAAYGEPNAPDLAGCSTSTMK